VLHRGRVYLVRLQEDLNLRRRQSGAANPKSSTGRLDVFARLITDHGTEFDTVRDGYKGPLWLEIAPRSFDVVVRRGSRLSQVRLRQGSPSMSERDIRRLHEQARILHDIDAEEPDIKQRAVGLSADLEGDPATGLVGFRARKTQPEPIDFDRIGAYAIDDFWEPLHRPERGGIVLDVDAFHILATKERVAVPVDHAADMVAYDTAVGEFRVHYAGFFDPGFGFGAAGSEGTTIVLEVRSHEVPFLIEHGQIVGRVLYERLTEPTDRPYGTGIGSSYYRQALTLAKQFKRPG
jgi:dCTP deaminase